MAASSKAKEEKVTRRATIEEDGAPRTIIFPDNWANWQCYLYAWALSPIGEKKLERWKKLVQELWPEPAFIWDDWSDLFFGACCGAVGTIERITGKVVPKVDFPWWRQTVATGCASSGKSSRTAMWILCCWLAAQEHTSCVLTSTSMDMLKRRIWSELNDWIDKSKYKFPLQVVASDTEIRWNKNDKKSAIFGRAVDEGGSVSKATDRIKGVHNRRVFVVIDEMTAVPEAITLACRNLDAGTMDFQLFGLGNARDKNDQHGIYCEPLEGWPAFNDDDQFWITKMGGCCVRFDAYKSPALKDPKRFHFYVNAEKIERDKRFYGGEHSPEFLSNIRGAWPVSGISNTVMDEALFTQFKVYEKAVWKSEPIMCGAADPAFQGGDRRVLYPFKFGQFKDGLTGIEFQEPLIISADTTQDVRFIYYQVADGYQRECERLKIAPENFIMDVTGNGMGLFNILSGRWSGKIQQVSFGGAAEKVQISPDNPATYHELYADKVTMLWYSLRRYIEGSQIKSLNDPETRQELCARERELRGGKTALQPKAKMKGLKHRSPDKADASVIASEFLRRQGISPAGVVGKSQSFSLERWNAYADKVNLDNNQRDYEDASAAFA